VQSSRATRLVLAFREESDARRVWAVLGRRFARYGLTLHPEKTRMIEFRRPARRPEGPGATGRNGTFDLLGFTHYGARSRKGFWVIKRKTAGERFRRSLRRVQQGCKQHRHEPVPRQAQRLSQKMRGHFGYFGITGNSRAIQRFRFQVVKIWRTWLNRRSQRAHMTWERMKRLLEHHPLPLARVVRPLHA